MYYQMPSPLKLLKTHEYAAYQLIFRMNSTLSEIEYAKATGKHVEYLETLAK